MSWRKLILVIIFIQDGVHSKEGSLKLQMKDGSFFFDDGNGDVPLEVMDKGPDISSIQDGSTKMVAADKAENGSDDKILFSSMEPINQQEKINELRRLLSESNIADAALGEESDFRLGTKINSLNIQNNVGPKSGKETTNVTDADMQKIREVLDREYGNSILLIPRNDLEYFINFVKEYSLNDLLRNSDSAEFQNSEDRMRLRDHSSKPVIPRYQLNWNKGVSKTQPTENIPLTPENRQLIVEEFSRLLDLLNVPKNTDKIQSITNNPMKLSDGSSNQIKSDIQNTIVHGQSKELASQESVKDILDNLSDDKSQLKQSLMRLFDKSSESESSQQSHSNFRRSLRKLSINSSPLKSLPLKSSSLKSSPVKKKKDKQRGNSQNFTDKATQYQRISREYNPMKYGTINLFPQRLPKAFNPSEALGEYANCKGSEFQQMAKQNQQSQMPEEHYMIGGQRTRADIIR